MTRHMNFFKRENARLQQSNVDLSRQVSQICAGIVNLSLYLFLYLVVIYFLNSYNLIVMCITLIFLYVFLNVTFSSILLITSRLFLINAFYVDLHFNCDVMGRM